MRVVALSMAIPLLLVGCMSRPPQKDRSGEISYNRRDLPPEQGLFTGCDGAWTVYRSRPDQPHSCPPSAGDERERRDPRGTGPGVGQADPD